MSMALHFASLKIEAWGNMEMTHLNNLVKVLDTVKNRTN